MVDGITLKFLLEHGLIQAASTLFAAMTAIGIALWGAWRARKESQKIASYRRNELLLKRRDMELRRLAELFSDGVETAYRITNRDSLVGADSKATLFEAHRMASRLVSCQSVLFPDIAGNVREFGGLFLAWENHPEEDELPGLRLEFGRVQDRLWASLNKHYEVEEIE